MKYIKVSNGSPVGEPFTLPTNYITDTGAVITNVDGLTTAEKITLGLYPVIENPAAEWETVPNYTVNPSDVTITYTPMPLDDYKNIKIAEVYQKAKTILDGLTEGYSVAEVAKWPAIQADVVMYNTNNVVVGPALQEAANLSAYTVSEIAALLTPRITAQNNALTKRATLVSAINAAIDHVSVAAIDIVTGW